MKKSKKSFMNKLFIVISLTLIPTLVFSQEKTKIYFIQKIDKSFISNSKQGIYQGAMAKVFLMKNQQKIDSIFIEADDFSKWKKTVSFSINLSKSFADKSPNILIIPVYHIAYKTVYRGVTETEIKDVAGQEKAIFQIKLKIKSAPDGATVYLIPKILWERNPSFAKYDESLLSHYLVTSGVTTTIFPVQEYVYIAVFSLNNKYKMMECRPSYLNPVDSIFLKLN